MRAARAASGPGKEEPEGTAAAGPHQAGLLAFLSSSQRQTVKLEKTEVSLIEGTVGEMFSPTDTWMQLMVSKI